MNEFSQILRTAQRLVKGDDAELEVVQSFPDHPRSNPQSGCLAVVGIQKVSILPLGMNDYYGEQLMPFGKRAKVWLKVSFCCKSGEECWKLWERTASRLLFSKELAVEQIECGEPAWQKDWGGVVLPVKFCCEFIIGSQEEGTGSEIGPEQIRVIRKGVI